MIERRSAATIVLSRRERISGAAHPVRAYCVTGKAITRRGFPRGFRLPVRVREAFSNDNYSHRNGHGRVTDCQIANCLGAASPRSVALENAERRVKGDADVIKHLNKVPSRAHVRQLRSAQSSRTTSAGIARRGAGCASRATGRVAHCEAVRRLARDSLGLIDAEVYRIGRRATAARPRG